MAAFFSFTLEIRGEYRQRKFTREDVKALRIAQGMSPDPRNVLNAWQTRRLVVKGEERGVFVKTSFSS